MTGNYTQTLRSCVGFHFRCLGLAVARHKRQQPSKPFPPGPPCFLACQIRQHLRRKALQNALCGTSHLETRIQLAAQDLEKVTQETCARDTSKAFRKVDCYFQILPWWCHFCDYLWANYFLFTTPNGRLSIFSTCLLGPYCLKHCFLPPETAAAAAGVLASAECEVPLHEQAKVHRARLQQCEAPAVNKECWRFRNYSHPGYFSFVYIVHYIDRDSSLSFSTAIQYKRLFGML